MKLTQRQFKKIIKETIKESRDNLIGTDELYGFSSYELINFAKKYAGMGDAVCEQLDDLLDDPSANLNSNAVDLIKEELGGLNEEIDDAIEAWLEENKPHSDEEEEPVVDDGSWQ